MNTRTASLAGALVATLTLLASPAGAQPVDTSSSAVALELYNKAKGLMSDKKYDVACPMLEEAIRLDPSGRGVLVTLGDCYEGAGRIASAWAAFTKAVSMIRAANDPRGTAYPQGRADALHDRRSSLEVAVPASIVAAPGVEILRDGKKIGEAEWNTPLPIDGGEHVVTLVVAGKRPHAARVNVAAEADVAKVVLPELGALEYAAAGPGVDPRPPTAPPDAQPHEAQRSAPVWAWVTGGLGLAAIAVGAGFRIDGYVVETDQADACGSARDACPASYDVAGTNARKERDYAVFVGLTVSGSLALGTGIVGLVVHAATAPDAKATAPTTAIVPFGDGRTTVGVAALGSF